jgi:hypothetical protein
MIYHFRDKNANHFILKAVDCGFIGGVMVSVIVSKAVDRGFIAGVMVSVLVSKAVDRGYTHDLLFSRPMLTRSDDPMIYHFRDKNANPPSMNP